MCVFLFGGSLRVVLFLIVLVLVDKSMEKKATRTNKASIIQAQLGSKQTGVFYKCSNKAKEITPYPYGGEALETV